MGRKVKSGQNRPKSALERLLKAFGTEGNFKCPAPLYPPPADAELFDVPQEVRAVLCLKETLAERAHRMIKDEPGGNDGGAWHRMNMLWDGLEYLINDYIRAVYGKSTRYSVEYADGWKCYFCIV